MKTNKKIVMCGAVIAAMAVAGITAISSLTTEIDAASKTTYGAFFSSSSNGVSALAGTVNINSQYSGSNTGEKYYYSYNIKNNAGGTGYGSGALTGDYEGCWLSVTAGSESSQSLTCAFFMNGIRNIQIDHVCTAGAENAITLYTSTTGYSTFEAYDSIPFSSFDTSGFTYGTSFIVDSDGSKNIQGVKFAIDVPVGTTLGISVTINWAC